MVTKHPVWRSWAPWINKRWPCPGEGLGWSMTWERMWEAEAGTGSKAQSLNKGEAESAPGWERDGEVPQGRDAKRGTLL